MKLTALLLAATVAICWGNSVMIKQDKVPTALHRLMTVTGATLEENDTPTLPCNEEGFYSHTSDCTKFYKCIDVSGNHDYEQLVFKCHAGTIFSAEYKSCIPGACSNGLESASASAAELSAVASAVVSAAASTTMAARNENRMLSLRADAASTDDYEVDHVTSSATSIFDSFMSKKSEDKKPPGLWKDGTVGSRGIKKGRDHEASGHMCYTGSCPGNGVFEEIAGNCYFFSDDRNLAFTWDDARRFCQEIGYLLGLTTVDLAEFGEDSCMSFGLMMQEIAEKDTTFWLGANTYALDPDAWFWMNSESSLSKMDSYWMQNQPNFDGNCMYASISNTNDILRSYFADGDCSIELSFVCQIM